MSVQNRGLRIPLVVTLKSKSRTLMQRDCRFSALMRLIQTHPDAGVIMTLRGMRSRREGRERGLS
jgi:hypothetical protein